MATLTIMRGLPASGKSTWARKHVADHPDTVIVSLDGLRRMMMGSLTDYHTRRTERTEQLVARAAHATVCDALRKGVNVIMDAQNATMERVRELVQLAANCDADVNIVAFTCSLGMLLECNRNRAEDDRVPEEYLRSQFKRFADGINTPMLWVRVPVEQQDTMTWKITPTGTVHALINLAAAYGLYEDIVDETVFRHYPVIGKNAFLPSRRTKWVADNGRVVWDMPRVARPPITQEFYCDWLERGAPCDNGVIREESPLLDRMCTQVEQVTLLDHMRFNPNVRVTPVKGEDDLWACNFTRDAFRNRQWDEYSTTARGLFLNSQGDVVMRGFDKFFNLDENPETSLENVLDHMEYPVCIETKMNGFLGLVGARDDNTLRYYSKSGQTDYSPLIRDHVTALLDERGVSETELGCMLNRLRVTLTFEIIDMESDRHIIRYPGSTAMFLHAIKNQRDFAIDREAESEVHRLCRFPQPGRIIGIPDRDGLRRQITLAQKDTGEGVVIYGANGYMVKVKSDLYRQSKRLRPLLENILLRGKPVPQDDSERSRLVRAVLAAIPREQLVYHQSAFDRDAVDMTRVTQWLAGHGNKQETAS